MIYPGKRRVGASCARLSSEGSFCAGEFLVIVAGELQQGSARDIHREEEYSRISPP